MHSIQRLILLFLIAFTSQLTIGQSINSTIIPNSLNKKYLEHLIKVKVDSVRALHNCKPLVNDSILYIAANHHTQYMIDNNRLTHIETDLPLTKTPQLRAEHYGAVNYLVGENVLKTTTNTTIKSKKGKTFNTGIYGQLAESIVAGWVNSPGHFKNIITPTYQITGVSIAYQNGKLYACQKFAEVLYKYEFKESATLFNYSSYTPPPLTNSFNGMAKGLIAHKYKWGLRHDKLEKCVECEELVKNKPFISLRYDRGNFYLRVENSDFVQALIQDRKDGFAVEIVEYNDYACGNPAYYTKPSRRNGQLKTNGIILKPLFKKELFKGYKKRKKKKEVNFLSYLFGADSVKFKNRFSHYKTANYKSEYFEIKLGRFPKGDVSGLWAHNLIYIQEGQICHVDYFTNYCGELFQDTIPFNFLPLDTNGFSYTFEKEHKAVPIKIPFEQNKSSYSKSDIVPFISSLKDVRYTIDSVYIKASASVEGDATSNELLQLKRANSILAVLQENQETPIPSRIETETAWDHFYKNVSNIKAFRSYRTLSKKEIQQAINSDPKLLDALEPILKQERNAAIKLYVTVKPTDTNMPFLAQKKLQELTEIIENPDRSETAQKLALNEFDRLYGYLHKKVVEKTLDAAVLAKVNLPKSPLFSIPLTEKFLLYGYEFEAAYQTNKQWLKTKESLRKKLAQQEHHLVSPIFLYNEAYFNTMALLGGKAEVDQTNIQLIIDQLKPLRALYNSNHYAKRYIEALNFNLNMMLVNSVFPANPNEASDDASIAIEQIKLYYEYYDLLDTSKVLQLVKAAVYYMNIDQAVTISSAYMDNPEILQYIVPLGYEHPSDENMWIYYESLIELSKNTSPNTWCNLFMNECTIPFQAFDHEKLRDTYCEICDGKNDFLNDFIQ